MSEKRVLNLDEILLMVEDAETNPDMVGYLAFEDIPALVAELREHREAIEALGAVYAAPSGPMDAVQQAVHHIRELEGERSKETIWATKRVLELEEEAVGLKRIISHVDERMTAYAVCKPGTCNSCDMLLEWHFCIPPELHWVDKEE